MAFRGTLAVLRWLHELDLRFPEKDEEEGFKKSLEPEVLRFGVAACLLHIIGSVDHIISIIRVPTGLVGLPFVRLLG